MKLFESADTICQVIGRLSRVCASFMSTTNTLPENKGNYCVRPV